MKTLIAVLLMSCFWSCLEEKKEAVIEPDSINDLKEAIKQAEDELGYIEVDVTYLDSLNFEQCVNQRIEFINAYARLDSIPSDTNEKLFLLEILKSNGYSVSNWSRGNWMEGPRIVSFELTRGKCTCQIDKLYYTAKEKGYKVTERLKCY